MPSAAKSKKLVTRRVKPQAKSMPMSEIRKKLNDWARKNGTMRDLKGRKVT